VLTVRRDSEAYKGTVFFEGLVGRVRYWLWKDGIIPDDIGAYANNEHRPDRQHIRKLMLSGGCFCMAVPTMYMRLAGLEVAYRPDLKGNKAWDGSISAAFDGPKYGNGYFHNEAVPFDMQRAKGWAEETRSAVLLGKGYSGSDPGKQGHTAVLLPSGFLLQSELGNGLHWNHRIEVERPYWENGGKMVHPHRWIELDGEERRKRLAPWAA
jgi:hypothetical protein